jgi:hypothetical protein
MRIFIEEFARWVEEYHRVNEAMYNKEADKEKPRETHYEFLAD